MSPRRSSRARLSQPSPLAPTQTNSSNSSVTSDRAQRATRSYNKLGSPQRSVPRSQSQDESEEVSKPPPRRTRSGHNEIKEPSPIVDANGELEEEDGQEEDEITRCVCEQSEYPGLSTPLIETLKKVGYAPPGDQTYEQLGDVFVCCDRCHVWQHAGCVGILGKINEPESYYCDVCREDLHSLSTSPEGQRFSRYAPIMDEPPYRMSPKPSTRNGKGKDGRPRLTSESSAHKRRITMNSRNEDEELARAIEESKKDKMETPSTTTTRTGKRSREDEEERKGTVKRPRTDSSTPPHEPKEETSDDEDGTATALLIDATPKKAIRGAAARNHQAKEAREQKERERQAAANARKARSDRRRGEDSDHEDRTNEKLPSTAASSPPPEPTPASSRTVINTNSNITINSSNTTNNNNNNNNNNNSNVSSSSSNNSNGTGNKKKQTPARRGRNVRTQHIRDRGSSGLEVAEEATSLLSTNPHNTRARSRSRSVVRGDEVNDKRGGLGTPNGAVPEPRVVNGYVSRINMFDDGGLLTKPSKAKNFNEKKTSMNEMKKRVAAILEFVHRAQNERVGAEGTSSAGMSRSTSGVGGAGGSSSAPHISGAVPTLAAMAESLTKQEGFDGRNLSKEEFEHLSAAEMLVSLRSRLVAFEGQFGRWGDNRS